MKNRDGKMYQYRMDGFHEISLLPGLLQTVILVVHFIALAVRRVKLHCFLIFDRRHSGKQV